MPQALVYNTNEWHFINMCLLSEVSKGYFYDFFSCCWIYIPNCCCLVTKLCLTLCDSMDCSPPGSSVHGILQGRILEWVAISFSRGSSHMKTESTSPAWQVDSLPLSHQGSPNSYYSINYFKEISLPWVKPHEHMNPLQPCSETSASPFQPSKNE